MSYANARANKQHYPPHPQATRQRPVPGRESGFVLGLLAALITPIPFICIPLAVVGWILSAKALRLMPAGVPGRGLALAGLILSIVAISLTVVFMLLAVPGAWQNNFG